MTEWHFFEPVMRRWVTLFVGPGEEFQKLLDQMGYKDDVDEHEYTRATGCCIELTAQNNDSGNNCCLIWMAEWSLATLVHEITHLVMFQMSQVHFDVDRDHSEPYAFYVEYWFTTMQRVRRKYPNGRKPAQARKGA